MEAGRNEIEREMVCYQCRAQILHLAILMLLTGRHPEHDPRHNLESINPPELHSTFRIRENAVYVQQMISHTNIYITSVF